MYSRRALLASAGIICVALAVTAVSSRAEDIAKACAEFVSDLAERVIKILKDKSIGKDDRVKALSQIFLDGFDVRAIGRFALGRYWQNASEADREDYLAAFRDYVVETYAARFNSYAGESFVVTKDIPDGEEGAVVFSDIGRPGEEPAHVQWRVRKTANGYKIVDVVVEGVSLLVTQREEFASVVQRHDGKVAALTALLREKIAQYKAQS